MFKTIYWIFKKNRELQKISQALMPDIRNPDSFAEAFAKGGFDAINPRLNQIEESKKQLFKLSRSFPPTKVVLSEIQVSDKELSNLYGELTVKGAGVFVSGHWVPASTFAYAQTLEYLLKNKDSGSEAFHDVCLRLRQFFERNETKI
ncbi:MAG: hypothetical protein WC701_12205 [Kiritimatiellales bacterium]|jgi:hypothetical protein